MWLRQLRKRCCRCGIHFFTSESNRRRTDLMCPFGCREERVRERGNERGCRHYRTPRGRRTKAELNRKRSRRRPELMSSCQAEPARPAHPVSQASPVGGCPAAPIVTPMTSVHPVVALVKVACAGVPVTTPGGSAELITPKSDEVNSLEGFVSSCPTTAPVPAGPIKLDPIDSVPLKAPTTYISPFAPMTPSMIAPKGDKDTQEDDPLSLIPPSILQYIGALLKFSSPGRTTAWGEIESFLREILGWITILRQRSLRGRGS
jgi:hypothetical protein